MESCDPSAACLGERANQRTGLAPYMAPSNRHQDHRRGPDMQPPAGAEPSTYVLRERRADTLRCTSTALTTTGSRRCPLMGIYGSVSLRCS